MTTKKPAGGDDGYVITDTGSVERVPAHDGGSSFWVNLPSPAYRPTEQDWQGALRWLLAKVANGESLPRGRGRQATVERWLAEWFRDQRNAYPSESLLKDQVRRIFQEVEKGQ